jgi:hypothetical protein
MDVNQTHPIKLAFCLLLNKQKKTSDREQYEIVCNTVATNAIINPNVKINPTQMWTLAYTLFKNPALKKERKKNIMKDDKRVEGFKKYALRTLNISRNVVDKRLSKSTPCLVEEIKGLSNEACSDDICLREK